MSRKDIADIIGVSHQQIEKNERPINKISAAQLIVLSVILELPVESFYENVTFEMLDHYCGGRLKNWVEPNLDR